ncbi:MAG: flagellin [Burkholderiales bacterium PBB4]|nr:MAG: flagellin [Burkholderiales bacterium PBB4]
MAATINTNINSLTAQRNLNTSQSSLSTSIQRLSSGLRINSAKDDAAGLAIADRFTSQIRGSQQAARNANDGISLSQVAEGSLGTAGTILQRVRELAVQSVNATNSASDRAALNAEAGQLTAELDRIAKTTQFNGQNILDGSLGSATFQVGANANQTITATTANFATSKYGINRIGSVVASATSTKGDLVQGSTANAVASSAAATSRVAGGDFTVDGSSGSATITVAAAATAKDVAALINAKTAKTNVTATARTEIDATAFGTGTFSLNVTSDNTNAVTITFATSGNTADGLAGAITAFNDKASQTGVTAKLNDAGTGITLTNASGNNITVLGNTGTTAGALVGGSSVDAAATAIVTGALTLDSDKTFGLSGVAATTNFFTAATAASQLQAVNTFDVSNVDAANRTLAAVDSALSAVNSQRASFGALQSRFETTIANLQTSSDNLSASRSRIQDADFAVETANLSRSQILQQAGTAMVAQANQLPQGVLALLR